MNISYNWLKELIDIDVAPAELAGKLTGVGLAVEGIEEPGDDSILDIDLTSNRSDCLSHLGVAREVGVIVDKPLKLTSESSTIPTPAVLAAEIVTIDDPDLCHRFTARIIRGVKIGPSPQWLVDRLESVGERSINNVADVTNYVMHELGQPMHAFDLDTLEENRIVVRRAKSGEKITTLDEVDRELDDTMLAICDAAKPVAIGGIIGGLDTSITAKTTNVLLEVAYFERSSIRSTARKLSIRTEASHRFERGVDIHNLVRASDRASHLIVQLAGGAIGDFIDVFPTPSDAKMVESADIAAAVTRLTGLEVPTDECMRILSELGLKSDNDHSFEVPSWRHDISIEEDLVEEIARHVGYDKIATDLPPAYFAGEHQPHESRERRLRLALSGNGFNEAMSYSFIDLSHDERFETVPKLKSSDVEFPFVTIRDAVIEGATLMRPTNLSGLLDAAKTNLNHQRRDLRLFEIGNAFGATSDPLETPIEVNLLSLLITGSERFADRELTGRAADFFDISGAVGLAAEAMGIDALVFEDAEVRHLQPGQAAKAMAGGEEIGYLGRLHEELASQYKFKSPVYVAELNLDGLLRVAQTETRYQPLPRFPSISRDVSLVVRKSVQFATILNAVMTDSPNLLSSVDFVDDFESEAVGTGKRSITLRLTYRDLDRTLHDSEVEVQHQEIVAKLGNLTS